MEGYSCWVEAPCFIIVRKVLRSLKDSLQCLQSIVRHLSVPIISNQIGDCFQHIFLEEDFQLLVAGHCYDIEQEDANLVFYFGVGVFRVGDRPVNDAVFDRREGEVLAAGEIAETNHHFQ